MNKLYILASSIAVLLALSGCNSGGSSDEAIVTGPQSLSCHNTDFSTRLEGQYTGPVAFVSSIIDVEPNATQPNRCIWQMQIDVSAVTQGSCRFEVNTTSGLVLEASDNTYFECLVEKRLFYFDISRSVWETDPVSVSALAREYVESPPLDAQWDSMYGIDSVRPRIYFEDDGSLDIEYSTNPLSGVDTSILLNKVVSP